MLQTVSVPGPEHVDSAYIECVMEEIAARLEVVLHCWQGPQVVSPAFSDLPPGHTHILSSNKGPVDSIINVGLHSNKHLRRTPSYSPEYCVERYRQPAVEK